MNIGYTELSTFKKCPGAFHFLRLNTKVPATHEANVGRLFHKFAEIYGKHCTDNKRMTDTSMVPQFMRQATKHVDSICAEYGNPYCTLDEQEEALAIAEQWAETTVFDPSRHYKHGEDCHGFMAIGDIDSVEGAELYNMKATLDRVDWRPEAPNHHTITVYKSGWKIEVDPLQAEFYAWLLILANAQRVTIDFDFVRYGITKSKEYTRDDFDVLQAKLKSIIEGIHGDTEHPCRPGSHCLSCNYASVCTATAAPVGAIASPEEARSAVENISLLERDLANAKAALRQYTDIYGPVSHNGTTWGMHVSETQRFEDVEKFIKSVACLGENPFAYLSINQAKAKKLLKKLPDLLIPRRSAKFCGKGVAEEVEE